MKPKGSLRNRMIISFWTGNATEDLIIHPSFAKFIGHLLKLTVGKLRYEAG